MCPRWKRRKTNTLLRAFVCLHPIARVPLVPMFIIEFELSAIKVSTHLSSDFSRMVWFPLVSVSRELPAGDIYALLSAQKCVDCLSARDASVMGLIAHTPRRGGQKSPQPEAGFGYKLFGVWKAVLSRLDVLQSGQQLSRPAHGSVRSWHFNQNTECVT